MKRVLSLAIAFYAAASLANETVTVYQLSGQRQCVEGGGVPAEQAADLLRGQGVKVMDAERRSLPLEPAELCGAPTGEANVITIAAADWAAFTNKNPDAGGYGLWVFDDTTAQVFMYDGTLQCGMGEEIPLEQMAEALRTKGIEVIESRKGTDGLMHISVCGASTGAINVFTINRDDLDAARELGFRLLVSRETSQRVKRPVKKRPAGMQIPGTPPAKTASPIPLLW
jgi:hypothetical protein